MADTRCANPDYQLDVDILTIEYVVFKAIEAQLTLLRSSSATQGSLINGALESHNACAEDAVRLTEIYDTLTSLFKQNHGLNQLREIVRLDGYLLQFLVLLNLWLRNETQSESAPAPLVSADMQQRLECDQFTNRFFRHFWLNKRERRNDAEALEAAQLPRQRNTQLSLADHLLPRFMHLSYEMRSQDADVSIMWMQLASNFMLHAAVEILDAPDLLKNGVQTAEVGLKECFAWGYIERPRFENNQRIMQKLLSAIEDKTAGVNRLSIDDCKDHIRKTAFLEDRVWDMLYDEGTTNGQAEDTTSTPHSSGEISEWTRMRQQTLENVLTTFATMQEEGDGTRHEPVEWLRNQYRQSTFLAEVGKFLALHWAGLHSAERGGKPVLVQIEEGGLYGLSEDEFVAFKQRARIGEEEWFDVIAN